MIRVGDPCYGIRCKNCGRPVAVRCDETRGLAPISYTTKATHRVTCPWPNCGHVSRFIPAEVGPLEALIDQELDVWPEVSAARPLSPDGV